MGKYLSKVVQCGALSLSVMCVESHSMIADEDLIERGGVGMNVHSVSIAENKRDFEMPSYLDLEIESNMIGIRAKGRIKGILLCVCLTTTCVVGGLSVLHFVGVLK